MFLNSGILDSTNNCQVFGNHDQVGYSSCKVSSLQACGGRGCPGCTGTCSLFIFQEGEVMAMLTAGLLE